RGLSVAIIDAEADGVGPTAVAEAVKELEPVLAAMVVYGHQPSASTQIMTAAGQAASAIKQSNNEQAVLLVGGHAAALTASTFPQVGADFVAAGEGLHPLTCLVEALKTPFPDFARVPGLWHWHDGQVRHTPDRVLVSDLDRDIPGPAWDLLPMQRYRAH